MLTGVDKTTHHVFRVQGVKDHCTDPVALSSVTNCFYASLSAEIEFIILRLPCKNETKSNKYVLRGNVFVSHLEYHIYGNHERMVQYECWTSCTLSWQSLLLSHSSRGHISIQVHKENPSLSWEISSVPGIDYDGTAISDK